MITREDIWQWSWLIRSPVADLRVLATIFAALFFGKFCNKYKTGGKKSGIPELKTTGWEPLSVFFIIWEKIDFFVISAWQ